MRPSLSVLPHSARWPCTRYIEDFGFCTRSIGLRGFQVGVHIDHKAVGACAWWVNDAASCSQPADWKENTRDIALLGKRLRAVRMDALETGDAARLETLYRGLYVASIAASTRNSTVAFSS